MSSTRGHFLFFRKYISLSANIVDPGIEPKRTERIFESQNTHPEIAIHRNTNISPDLFY